MFLILLLAFHLFESHEHEKLVDKFRTLPLLGTPPSPRSSSVFVPIADNNDHITYYLFGGIDSKGNYFTNVMEFDPDFGWSAVEYNGIQKPPQRIDFAWYTNDKSFFLWGGKGPDGFYDDLWEFNTVTREWSQLEQGKNRPSPRQKSSFGVNKDYFILFGGRDTDGRKNDLWRMNLNTFEWEEFILNPEDVNNNNNIPSARKSAQAFVTDDYVFVFGGYCKDDNKDTTCTIYRANINYDFSSSYLIWNKVSLKSDGVDSSFVRRYDCGYYTYGDKAYIYKGIYSDGVIDHYVNNMVVLDFSNAYNEDIEQSYVSYVEYENSTHANSLSLSSLVVFEEKDEEGNTYFRGYSYGGVCNEVFDGNMSEFNNKNSPSSSSSSSSSSTSSNSINFNVFVLCPGIPNMPSPRSHHKSVLALGRMWIFGGVGISSEINGLTSTSQKVDYLNDLYSFDVINREGWREEECVDGARPPARAYFSFVEHSGRLIIFGGLGKDPSSGISTPLNDIWEYSIMSQKWTQINPRNEENDGDEGSENELIIPKPRYNSGAIVIHKCLYIFGGRMEDNSVTNEMWRFSLVTHRWKKCTFKEWPSESSKKHFSSLSLSSSSLSSSSNIKYLSSLFPHIYPQDLINTWKSKKYNDFDPSTSPLPRGGLTMMTKEELLDMPDGNENHDEIIVAGGLTESRRSVDTPQVFVLPLETDEYDNNFVIYIRTDITLPDKEEEYSPIYGEAPTVVTQNGFFSVGGLKIDDAKDRFNYYSFEDTSKPLFYVHQMNEGEEEPEHPVFSGGSAVYFGRSMFVFGGTIVSRNLPSFLQFNNQLYVFTLNSNIFTCSPGTVNTSSSYYSSSYSYASSYNEKNGEINKDRFSFEDENEETYNSLLSKIIFEVLYSSPSFHHSSTSAHSSFPLLSSSSTLVEYEDSCIACEKGTFQKNFNQASCTECYAGTFNNYEGGSTGYHCSACPAGYYSNTSKTAECIKCEDGSYCPLGSVNNNNDYPVSDGNDMQPQPMSTKDDLFMYITVVCYVGGVVVGIIFGLIFCCFPCRKLFVRCDIFSENHNLELDEDTNSAPKIVRKTQFGGFLAVVFVFFALGTIVAMLLQYIMNNLNETKSVIYAVMDKDINLDSVNINYFESVITFIDYCGSCTEDDTVESDEFTKCHKSLIVTTNDIYTYDNDKNLVPPEYTCRLVSSTNTFFKNTSNCEIKIESSNAAMKFEDDNSTAFFRVRTQADDALAYAVKADVEVDTGIGYGKRKLEQRISRKQLLSIPKENLTLKGNVNTDFHYDVLGSLFINSQNQGTTGLQLVDWSYERGSVAQSDEIYAKYGLGAIIEYETNNNVVKTEWVYRQQFTAFLSNILSTVTGFMGVFGIILMVCEYLYSKGYVKCLCFNTECFETVMGEGDDGSSSVHSKEREMSSAE